MKGLISVKYAKVFSTILVSLMVEECFTRQIGGPFSLLFRSCKVPDLSAIQPYSWDLLRSVFKLFKLGRLETNSMGVSLSGRRKVVG